MGRLRTSQRRAEAALELVRKQRRLVETTEVGSPAHRQASDVLALIEESHFLLSELDRMSARPPVAEPAEPAAPVVEAREPWPRVKARALGKEPTRS